MYEVQMRYIDLGNSGNKLNFRCERFNIENNQYKFENIFIDDFIISEMEINNEDIALIKVR